MSTCTRTRSIVKAPAPGGRRSARSSPRRVLSFVLFAGLLVVALLSSREAKGQSGEAAGSGNVVTLRTSIRVEASRPLTLADVAELSGDEAERAGATVVTREKVTEGLKIDISAIRRALEADKSVNLGRIRLTGNACVVHVGATPVPRSERAMAGSVLPSPEIPGVEKIRDRVTQHLAELFGVDLADLRLTFENDDAPLLARAIGASTVGIQPLGSGDKIPISIRIYEGERLASSGSVRVGVEMRRSVLVAARTISRGEVIDLETATSDRQWLPATANPAVAEDAIGQLARGQIRAGEVINARDIEPPVVIKKGDMVAVDCICGGVIVRANARAMEPGRVGEVIQFKPLSSKSVVRARVSGPGVAVLNAPAGLEAPDAALGGSR